MGKLFLQLLYFLFLEETSIVSGLNTVYVVVGIIIIFAIGFIVFISKRRLEIQLTDTMRADALEKLLKTRDAEVLEITKSYNVTLKEKDKIAEDKNSLEIEYKTLLGINVKELMDYWLIKEDIEAQIKNLQSQLRVEKKRYDNK